MKKTKTYLDKLMEDKKFYKMFNEEYTELAAAEKALSRGMPKEEIRFKSGDDMVKFFKNKVKK